MHTDDCLNSIIIVLLKTGEKNIKVFGIFFRFFSVVKYSKYLGEYCCHEVFRPGQTRQSVWKITDRSYERRRGLRRKTKTVLRWTARVISDNTLRLEY